MRKITTKQLVASQERQQRSAHIAQMFQAGQSPREIAALLSLNRNRVVSILKRGGYHPVSEIVPDSEKGAIYFSGSKLATVRRNAKYTRERLGVEIGVSNPDMIRRWEKGETTPESRFILRILIVLGISASKIAEKKIK